MMWLEMERSDGLVRLTLNHGRTHALDSQLVDDLLGSFRALKGDAGIKAVILTGAGDRFFCSGLDVGALLPLTRADMADFFDRFTALFTEMYLFPRPLVAAINGHAIAGGLILAMTADYQIVGAETATLGLSEVQLGLPVPMGAICMLSALVGPREAHRLALSGERLLPEAAYRSGLIHEVTSSRHLREVSETVARDLASTPASGFAHTKRYLRLNAATAMGAGAVASRNEFLDCWFEPAAQAALRKLAQRSAPPG